MTAARVSPGPLGREFDWVGPTLLVPPGVLLALLSSWGVGIGVLLALGGALGFAGLGMIPWARTHALPVLVPLAAYGLLALTVPAVPLASLLAGVGAIAVLLALGRASAAPAYRGRAWRGLGAPFLGFLVAFATAIVLPANRQYVGVAALLAVIAIAALAILFAAPDREEGLGAEAS